VFKECDVKWLLNPTVAFLDASGEEADSVHQGLYGFGLSFWMIHLQYYLIFKGRPIFHNAQSDKSWTYPLVSPQSSRDIGFSGELVLE